jgi:thymidylate kinase
MTKTVVFEGHDGVGKSSLITQTYQLLQEKGFEVICLRTPIPEVEVYRKDAEKLGANPWYYLFSWMISEKLCQEKHRDKDYILIDRSYFSTWVSFTARNLEFPNQLLQFFTHPDYKIWVRVKEKTRIERMERRGILNHDLVTMNHSLMSSADGLYAQMGFIEIWNDKDIKEVAHDVLNKIGAI